MTPERLAFLRGPAGGGRMLSAEECAELADAYEAQRDNALTAWRTARDLAIIAHFPADAAAAMAEITWLEASIR